MDLTFCISVYLVIWWTVLFAVLPLGSQSHHEAGLKVPGGGDPASPVNPRLLKKFITTTWVAALVFAVVFVCMQFHLVRLPELPG
jgi:predicted secreted protein